MINPFLFEECTHHIWLTLLGHQVLLAVDSPRVAEILAEAFSSSFFAPASDEPTMTFFCRTECEGPWDMVMKFPDITFVSRSSRRRSHTHDLFRWSEGQIFPVGHFSYKNSNDLSSNPTRSEIFAAYFQRRVLDAVLKNNSPLRLIHGGSLAHHGSGVLLLAQSKGGKSTLVLASVLARMQFLSDDHTPVDLRQGLLYPFPRALRLRQGSCDMIPEFLGFSSGRELDPTGETRYYIHPEIVRDHALGKPTKLTHIVKMNGFSKQAKVGPANPADMAIYCAGADFFPEPHKSLSLVWQWGDLIEGAKCASLQVGHPLETAELLRIFLEKK